MTQIDMTYEGDLSTLSILSENGSEIRTDAPKAHQGLGRVFSPTDLFAASLGSCMLTLMGIVAKSLNIDIKGMRAKINKEMVVAPIRRIGKVRIDFECPYQPSDEAIAKLIHAAKNCPVHNSLHPDIVLEFTYTWGK